jgi:uncharacterized integral membrane protein
VTCPASGGPPERLGARDSTPFDEPPLPHEQEAAPRASDTPATGAPPATGQAIPRTKTGIAFGTLIAGAVVLILLLVFILENTQSVKISFFGASGHLPLGVALLLAAIGGALLVGIVGTARIVQLRRHVKRRRRR